MIRGVFLLLIIIISVQVYAQPQVVAHRGHWNSEGSAQNSIVALYKADKLDIYGSEFDVLITADGIPIVNHDDIINGLSIEDTNYEELRDIKLKNGEILPTLEQYLIHGKACKDIKLILEIKPHSTKRKEIQAVNEVLELVNRMELQDRIEYISFSMDICRELIKKQPEAHVSYLKGDVEPAVLKNMGFSGIDYHYTVLDRHPEWIKEAKILGLTVNVWTVNDMALMEALIDKRVDLITTDRPSLLREMLEAMK